MKQPCAGRSRFSGRPRTRSSQRSWPRYAKGWRSSWRKTTADRIGPGTSARKPLWVSGFDGAPQTPAGGEVADDPGVDRPTDGHKVFQDPVHGVLVEDAEVAEGVDVQFQGLQLHAELVRHVDDADRAEVGQPGLGADGRVFRHLDGDLVPLELVWPGLDGRQLGLEPAAGMRLRVVGRLLFHTWVIHSVWPSFSSSKYRTTQGHIISGKTSQ